MVALTKWFNASSYNFIKDVAGEQWGIDPNCFRRDWYRVQRLQPFAKENRSPRVLGGISSTLSAGGFLTGAINRTLAS
jgi:hypothetical protein